MSMIKKILLRRLPEAMLFGLVTMASVCAGGVMKGRGTLLSMLLFAISSACYLAVRTFLEWLALR